MPLLDRDAVQIHYEEHGSGPPVLLSHGYSATSQMWAGQVEALKDTYKVIIWDMRGHGQSDSPEDQSLYSEAATIDDMAGILKACGVERAVIGGLSLGGFMSLAFQIKYPEMVRALLLFDTGPGYRNDEARDGWNARAEKTATRFLERGLDALGKTEEVKVSTHRSAEGLARAARGMLAQTDARIIDSLPAVQVPALVLVGADDAPFIGATDYMAKKIANAVKVVIPDAGHAANLDQPGPFNEATLEFLAGLPSD